MSEKIFRCGKCGEVITGIREVTEVRRNGCPNCGGTYFEKDVEEGEDYPLRGTNHVPVSIW